MSKHLDRTTKPVVAPFFTLNPDWFDPLGKGLFRSFVPESLRLADAIKVEEFREDDMLVVRAEMPGLDPDKDIDVSVENDTLRIHAERSEKTEDTQKDHYRSEFRYGSFTRFVELPAGTSLDDVKASYRDGILEVRLPVDTEKVGARKVAIAR